MLAAKCLLAGCSNEGFKIYDTSLPLALLLHNVVISEEKND